MIRFREFITDLGVSRITGHRCRERGWIATINIAGIPYVRREAIQEFKRRAEAGEFAKSWTRGKGEA